MYKKKFDKDKKPKTGLNMEFKTFESGVPSKEHISGGSELLQFKAFRDMQMKGSIEVKADPNVEAGKGNYPYAILNRTNRVVEANYPGYDNISGNSIVRLANSAKSQFLNLFDSVVMIKRINYLYAAYENGNVAATKSENIAYNIELVKAIDQALSYGYSTMLTQLAFYTDYCESNLPRAGAYVDKANDNYDKMGVLLHYQTVQQNMIGPLAKYTELLSLEGELMDMSFRREAPLIQQLFGQLKKKAFIAQLNAIGTNIIGEYFDVDWYKQANALRHIPSRRSNDMNNPLITMVTTHKIPHIKLYSTETKVEANLYYDSENALKVASARLANPETFVIEDRTNVTLEEIILNVSKLLDAHYVLTWTRKLNMDLLPEEGTVIRQASAYYQCIVDYLNVLAGIATRFSTNMTEVRTFLDKLADTGMVYWKKGVAFSVEKIEKVPLTYNQVIADILKSTLGGAYDVSYDLTTKRWNCDTEWNMYTGINEYDKRSGGSFLTFGTRKIDLTAFTSGTTIDYTDSALLIPILFDKIPVITPNPTSIPSGHEWAGVKAVNRLGFDTEIYTYHIDSSALSTNTSLSRLNPITSDPLSIKAPNWFAPTATMSGGELARCASAMHKLLVQTVGYDRLLVDTTRYESMLNDDLLSFVDLQLEDVSNAMIQFARNYSPFRVATADGKRSIGFGK